MEFSDRVIDINYLSADHLTVYNDTTFAPIFTKNRVTEATTDIGYDNNL